MFAAGRRFYDRLDGVRELLTDPAVTSVRLVVNPERMVIAEARRTYTYLSLFGYRVDAVVANRLLPDDITDPWFEKWRELHAEHLATIESSFAPLPVLRAELAADELVGPDRLREFGDAVYGDLDPAAVLHEGETAEGHSARRRLPPHAAAPVRRPRRPRGGPQGRRAARARGAVPAGPGAARLPAPAHHHRRDAPTGQTEGRIRRGRARRRGEVSVEPRE